MKYVIDEDIVNKNGLSLSDFFILVATIADPRITDNIYTLIETGYITADEEGFFKVKSIYKDIISKILLTSDKAVPKEDRCKKLAIDLRALFPKGIKTGSAAWRGNEREITLRLQKFFKLYGDNWTDEEIIEATKRYIASFNGDYTYMKILKYFIFKPETKMGEDGKGYIEEVSNLANWLENPEETEVIDDWVDIK